MQSFLEKANQLKAAATQQAAQQHSGSSAAAAAAVQQQLELHQAKMAALAAQPMLPPPPPLEDLLRMSVGSSPGRTLATRSSSSPPPMTRSGGGAPHSEVAPSDGAPTPTNATDNPGTLSVELGKYDTAAAATSRDVSPMAPGSSASQACAGMRLQPPGMLRSSGAAGLSPSSSSSSTNMMLGPRLPLQQMPTMAPAGGQGSGDVASAVLSALWGASPQLAQQFAAGYYGPKAAAAMAASPPPAHADAAVARDGFASAIGHVLTAPGFTDLGAASARVADALRRSVQQGTGDSESLTQATQRIANQVGCASTFDAAVDVVPRGDWDSVRPSRQLSTRLFRHMAT